jgi:nucleoside-diphosphate-sugar epimerase
MKTIAVTGSSGFIGRHLLVEFKNNPYKVIEIDYDKGVDLLKPEDVNKVPFFDVIVHLAARSFVPASFENPFEFYHDNYLTTLNVLELARKYDSKVIYFSSYLYGQPESLPIDELHPLKPHNPYAQSKLICEKLCEGYARDFNVPVIVFRPFNIYGKGQNSSFLIPMIIEQLKSGAIHLKNPRPKRDFVYIKDVIDAVMLAIEFNNSNYEVLNLGYGKSYSISEVINTILRESNISASVSFSNEIRPGEVLDTVACNKKITDCLGWSPKVGLIEGINHVLII